MGLMTSSRSGGGRIAALLGGIGLGAAVMYVLDPQGGRRRRALARDKAVSLANKTGRVVEATSRDLANRAKGVAADARAKISKPNGGREEGHVDETRQRDSERPDEGTF